MSKKALKPFPKKLYVYQESGEEYYMCNESALECVDVSEKNRLVAVYSLERSGKIKADIS